MGNAFIADPLNHVKPGDIVKVRVISLDVDRKRIGFSMKSEQAAQSATTKADTKSEVKTEPSAKPERRNGQAKNDNDVKKSRPAKSNGAKPTRSKPERAADKPEKIGSLGALLAQAGLKKSQ